MWKFVPVTTISTACSKIMYICICIHSKMSMCLKCTNVMYSMYSVDENKIAAYIDRSLWWKCSSCGVRGKSGLHDFTVVDLKD